MGASLYGKAAEDVQKQAAVLTINKGLETIAEIYSELEEVAIEHGISFSYHGPAGYGDGGYFDPADIGTKEYEWDQPSDGWLASSQSC